MVEINNQRKAFLDMLAWSEELITDVKKPIMVMTSLWAELLLITRSPHKLVTLIKLKSTKRRTLPASFPLVGCLPQATAWKTSRKVRTLWHCSRLRSVALYLWLIVVISVGQSTRCSNIWASLPAGYGQFEHKADSLIAKFKEASQTVRDWCMSRVTAIISALVICIIVCLSWAVNHFIDNAITYKAQRDKNARELKLANAAITDMQMRQRDVAALDAKYTKS